MNHLNDIQRAWLARHGIEAGEQHGEVIECLTAQGQRLYTIADLQRIAQPGIGQRIKNWIAGVAA